MEGEEVNPFMVELIVRSLLKKVKDIKQIKELRKVCQLWDEINLEELENRAYKRQIRPIEFFITLNRFEGNRNRPMRRILGLNIAEIEEFEEKEMQEKLDQFLEDTREIRQLFRNFSFRFPHCISLFNQQKLENCVHIFEDYSPLFVQIVLSFGFKFNNDRSIRARFFYNQMNLGDTRIHLRVFLGWVAPSCKELRFQNEHPNKMGRIKALPDPPNWAGPLSTPNLEKVDINLFETEKMEIQNILGIIFGEDGSNKTPKLYSLKLENFEKTNFLRPCFWTNLNDLNLRFEPKNDEDFSNLSTNLGSLGQFGMHLKKLSLELGIYSTPCSDFTQICYKLSQFFVTQAKSLESLNLSIYYFPEEYYPEGNFQFPNFESLKKLRIVIKTIFKPPNQPGVNLDLYQLEDLVLNCPKLSTLELPDLNGIDTRIYKIGEILPIPIKCLKIFGAHFINEPEVQLTNFFSVEEFQCYGSFLSKAGCEIPWIDSVRMLTVQELKEPLHLWHLKCLRVLTLVENLWVPFGNLEYLELIKNLAGLNLNLLRICGYKIDEELKREYIKTFPFRIEFEEDYNL